MHQLPVPSVSFWSHVELLVRTKRNSAIWFGAPVLSVPLWYLKRWHKHTKVSQSDQLFCSPLKRPFSKAMQHTSPKVKYPPSLMQPKVKEMSSKSNYCKVTAEVNWGWGKVLRDAKKKVFFPRRKEIKHVNRFPPDFTHNPFLPRNPSENAGKMPLILAPWGTSHKKCWIGNNLKNRKAGDVFPVLEVTLMRIVKIWTLQIQTPPNSNNIQRNGGRTPQNSTLFVLWSLMVPFLPTLVCLNWP